MDKQELKNAKSLGIDVNLHFMKGWINWLTPVQWCEWYPIIAAVFTLLDVQLLRAVFIEFPQESFVVNNIGEVISSSGFYGRNSFRYHC